MGWWMQKYWARQMAIHSQVWHEKAQLMGFVMGMWRAVEMCHYCWGVRPMGWQKCETNRMGSLMGRLLVWQMGIHCGVWPRTKK